MSIFIYVRTWLAMCNKINKDCIAIFFYIFSSSGSRFMWNSFSLCPKSSADLLFVQCHKLNYLKKWINNSYLLLKCPYLRGKKPFALAKRFYFPFKLSSGEKFFKLSGFRFCSGTCYAAAGLVNIIKMVPLGLHLSHATGSPDPSVSRLSGEQKANARVNFCSTKISVN